jgi:hypothetical protein
MQTASKILTNQATIMPSKCTDSEKSLQLMLAEAESVASLILSEIMLRWPQQTKTWDKPRVARAWANGMAESGIIDRRRLGAALRKLTDRPYPPELGALLNVALHPVGEHEAELAIEKINRAYATTPPAWHTLSKEQYYCACGISEMEVKNAPSGRQNLVLRVLDLLNYAHTHPHMLFNVPAMSAASIEQKPTAEIVEREKKAIFAILGIKKSPLPVG